MPSDAESQSGSQSESQSESFSPNQIVCIEQGDLRLFAEVVQMVPERSRCWARPLAIAQGIPDSLSLELRHDLRESSHLLLPAGVFRAALDVEVMPLMSVLYHPEKTESGEDAPIESVTRQALHQFVQRLHLPR